MSPRLLISLVLAALFSMAAPGELSGQRTVYLVLGSDTAIWDGMDVARFRCTYVDALFTNTSFNGYRVMDPAFRNALRDSYGQPMKLTWWMMGGNIFRYATNRNVPLANTMTLHLMNKHHGESIRRFGDELTLHYHTFHWSDYNADGVYWWNQARSFQECRDDFDVTLAQYLLEERVFPVSFRSGWHYMDNGWQRYLDELLPFSMHDDWPTFRRDTVEPIDNDYDWSKSSKEFVPFHPSYDNYQLPGNLKGWNVRSEHIGSVDAAVMSSIFSKAGAGVDQVACLWGHLPETDFLDNLQKIDRLAHEAARAYPSVTFRYCSAVEAMQRWLASQDTTRPLVKIEEMRAGNNARFVVTSNEPIFQAQPFVALKDVYERYSRALTTQTGERQWTTIDQFPLAMIAKVGVALTDTVGNLQTDFILYKPDDVYLDNRDSSYAETAGTWTTVSSRSWGVDARTAVLAQTDSAVVQWRPRLSQTDTYSILIQVPAVQNAAGRIQIRAFNGVQPVFSRHFEQPLAAGAWVYVGTARLERDGNPIIVMTVRGENQQGKIVAADVLKLTPLVRERQLVLGVSSVNFGEVSESDTALASLAVQNAGTSVLTISSISSKSGLAFPLVAFPVLVQAMESLTLPIGIYGKARGVLTDTLLIVSDDPSQTVALVPVTGRVTAYYVVVDNEDAFRYKESGNWYTSVAQAFGASSRYAWTTDAGSSVRFTTALKKAGTFDIQAIVPKTVNSSTKARYTLAVNGVSVDSLVLDQNSGSGSWITLFTRYIPPSVSVTVTLRDVTPVPVSGVVLRADALKVSLREAATVVDTFSERDVPSELLLAQNHPNPFNPATKIVYGVSRECAVRLTVFDLLGREIAVLVDAVRRPGWYETAFRPQKLPSGVYLYRLEGEGSLRVRKMLFLK